MNHGATGPRARRSRGVIFMMVVIAGHAWATEAIEIARAVVRT